MRAEVNCCRSLPTKGRCNLDKRGLIRILSLVLAVLLIGQPEVFAQTRTAPVGALIATPTISIAAATADTTPVSSTTAHEAQIFFNFGTVSGSYTTCTVQAKTSYDGSTYLTLGSAATVTATSNTANAWTVIEQLGTTSVTTSSVSSTVALGFGQLTKFTFACSGYGVSAPVTVTVIFR